MKCPKCGKRMTLREEGWTHIYNLGQYMKGGEELCTYTVKERQTEVDQPRKERRE